MNKIEFANGCNSYINNKISEESFKSMISVDGCGDNRFIEKIKSSICIIKSIHDSSSIDGQVNILDYSNSERFKNMINIGNILLDNLDSTSYIMRDTCISYKHLRNPLKAKFRKETVNHLSTMPLRSRLANVSASNAVAKEVCVTVDSVSLGIENKNSSDMFLALGNLVSVLCESVSSLITSIGLEVGSVNGSDLSDSVQWD